MPESMNQKGSKRGFAAMDAEKRRKIASEGGKAAHQSGRAHQWTSVEAREAGRKGGKATHAGRREALEGGMMGDKANEGEQGL